MSDKDFDYCVTSPTPNAIDAIAVTTPMTPAPANNPLAITFAWSSCCVGLLLRHHPLALALAAMTTENSGGMMNAIPALRVVPYEAMAGWS